MKKILSVPMILLALFSIHSICEAATIRGSVKEIHSGAGRAAAANQVTVTLYRGVLGSSDLQKVETFRTGIDGLYHFKNIPKGEYTIHVQDPNVKEPNWGPAAYRRVSVVDDNAVIELDPDGYRLQVMHSLLPLTDKRDIVGLRAAIDTLDCGFTNLKDLSRTARGRRAKMRIHLKTITQIRFKV